MPALRLLRVCDSDLRAGLPVSSISLPSPCPLRLQNETPSLEIRSGVGESRPQGTTAEAAVSARCEACWGHRAPRVERGPPSRLWGGSWASCRATPAPFPGKLPRSPREVTKVLWDAAGRQTQVCQVPGTVVTQNHGRKHVVSELSGAVSPCWGDGQKTLRGQGTGWGWPGGGGPGGRRQVGSRAQVLWAHAWVREEGGQAAVSGRGGARGLAKASALLAESWDWRARVLHSVTCIEGGARSEGGAPGHLPLRGFRGRDREGEKE